MSCASFQGQVDARLWKESEDETLEDGWRAASCYDVFRIAGLQPKIDSSTKQLKTIRADANVLKGDWKFAILSDGVVSKIDEETDSDDDGDDDEAREDPRRPPQPNDAPRKRLISVQHTLKSKFIVEALEQLGNPPIKLVAKSTSLSSKDDPIDAEDIEIIPTERSTPSDFRLMSCEDVKRINPLQTRQIWSLLAGEFIFGRQCALLADGVVEGGALGGGNGQFGSFFDCSHVGDLGIGKVWIKRKLPYLLPVIKEGAKIKSTEESKEGCCSRCCSSCCSRCCCSCMASRVKGVEAKVATRV